MAGVERPHIAWWVAIVIGMAHCFQMGFIGMWYNPFPFLEPQLAQNVIRYIFIAAVVAHVGEASYAAFLCSKYKQSDIFGWWIQTFILGFPSLRLLKRRVAKLQTSKSS
eukprot:TRINITY_DN903_c0_g1_i1.p2 TRINITY_DN903_c0_g1~~TRINITY_DN903_c0_g1_i1.p2  ORF type:complete len:118 (-),score=36.04 TRINITY_DN903_c0_g1_i1:22-348(-)